jgi:hypothetical protein
MSTLGLQCRRPGADAHVHKLAMLLGQYSNDTKGLRLDLAITLHNGQEIWLDHDNTHCTSTPHNPLQYAPKDLKLHARRDLYMTENNHGGRIDVKHRLFQQASPAIDVMVKSKTLRYIALHSLNSRKRKYPLSGRPAPHSSPPQCHMKVNFPHN